MGSYIHRDILAGYMAGNLEQEDYFHEPIELYGVMIESEDQQCFISSDKMEIAVKAYNHCVLGERVSKLYIVAKIVNPNNIEDEKNDLSNEFKQEIEQDARGNLIVLKEPIIGAAQLDLETAKNSLSGFVYENGVKKAYANAFIAETIDKWLEKVDKGENVSQIVLKEIDKEIVPSKQIKLFKEELLNMH